MRFLIVESVLDFNTVSSHANIFISSSIMCLFLCFIIVLFLGCIIYGASIVLVKRSFKDQEKVSPYECGFSPFEDARSQFEIQFYVIAILFIIFDVEINFLFPWVFVFDYLTLTGFVVMLFFLMLLTLGFVFEWSWDALDWQ